MTIEAAASFKYSLPGLIRRSIIYLTQSDILTYSEALSAVNKSFERVSNFKVFTCTRMSLITGLEYGIEQWNGK